MRNLIHALLILASLAVPLTSGSYAAESSLTDRDGNVIIQDVGTGDINILVGYVGGDDPAAAGQAAALLESFGADSVPALVGALTDPGRVNPALDILADIGDASSAAPIAKLIADARPGVAGRALDALSRIGDPSVGPLVALAKDKAYTTTAFDAMKGVRQPSDASREAVRGLIGSEDPQVRTGALGVLGAWHDSGSADDVAAAMKDADPEVRLAAVVAYRLVTDVYDSALVASMLSDPSAGVRQAAGMIIVSKPDPAYAAPLVAAYGKEADVMARSVLLSAIAETHAGGAEKHLLDALDSDKPDMVSTALWYLDDYKTPGAGERIAALFREDRPVTKDMLVKQEALRALKNLGQPVGLGPFLKYIGKDSDAPTRQLAIDMIRELARPGDKQTEAALDEFVARETDPGMRKAAQDALERIR